MGTPVDCVGVVGLGIDFRPVSVFRLAIKTGLVAVVANAGSLGVDLEEEGVLVAVGGDAFDDEAMAGAFAFEPELLARAAIEGGIPRFKGFVEGFLVHEADHEDATGGVVLNDGGNQAVRFIEV